MEKNRDNFTVEVAQDQMMNLFPNLIGYQNSKSGRFLILSSVGVGWGLNILPDTTFKVQGQIHKSKNTSKIMLLV